MLKMINKSYSVKSYFVQFKSAELGSLFMSSGMGKAGILFFIVCTCCSAERQYFPQHNVSTWEEARQHCQLCYKELVSLTSENIQLLVQNLSSDYWVGLRKNLSNSMFWSQWSNGEPMTFQNWYPGQPKLWTVNFGDLCANISITEESHSQDDVCVIEREEFCTNITSASNKYMSSKKRSNNLIHAVEAPENPCVSLLSSGMWMGKGCTELLPYICYEDRFYGNATVSNVTLNSITVSWLAGPGEINLYKVELGGDIHLVENTTELTMNFFNLTSGTKYRVQVFPVKCDRDLNPQNATFYTSEFEKPERVSDLSVINVTIDSASLCWIKPVGNHSFYKVKVNGPDFSLNTFIVRNESIQIENLIPGGNYTFTVNAEVEDLSETGDTVSTSAFTKPDTVRELSVNKTTRDTIFLTWIPPKGRSCCFRVYVQQEKGNNFLDKTLAETNLTVENLTSGTEFRLSVAALAVMMPNGSVEGEAITIINTTEPSPVPNLTLSSSTNNITAWWDRPEGNFDFYRLKLERGNIQSAEITTNETFHTFENLHSAVNYSLTIYTELNKTHLQSDGVSQWAFTLPMEPENLRVVSSNLTAISLKWDVPEKMQGSMATFGVDFNAAFWSHTGQKKVEESNVTFERLKSGTNYTFEVRTLAGGLSSRSVSTSALTEPNKKSLTLVMQCSHETPLLCEDSNTQDKLLEEVKMPSFLQLLYMSHFVWLPYSDVRIRELA